MKKLKHSNFSRLLSFKKVVKILKQEIKLTSTLDGKCKIFSACYIASFTISYTYIAGNIIENSGAEILH